MTDTNTAEKTEDKELTPAEQCQAMHDKGMGEDEIIGALSQYNNMSIMKAVGIFKKFQKAAGLILSKEDRVAKIAELVGACVTPAVKQNKSKKIEAKPATVDLEKAVTSLVTELDITKGAAKGHVRRYCKANEVEMPSRAAITAQALEVYKVTVVDGVKAGKSKADVIKALQEAFPLKDANGNDTEDGLDEKAAKRTYGRVAKAEGLAASRTAIDYGPVIEWLKKNGAEYATKDGLATALQAELEMSPSAAKGVWKLYSFAKQFCA